MFLETDNVREAIVKSFDKPVRYKEMVLLFGKVVLMFKKYMQYNAHIISWS